MPLVEIISTIAALAAIVSVGFGLYERRLRAMGKPWISDVATFTPKADRLHIAFRLYPGDVTVHYKSIKVPGYQITTPCSREGITYRSRIHQWRPSEDAFKDSLSFDVRLRPNEAPLEVLLVVKPRPQGKFEISCQSSFICMRTKIKLKAK